MIRPEVKPDRGRGWRGRIVALDTYTHTTGDMQKRAAEIVDEFLTDIFGEELKPWQKSGKTEKELSA